MPMIIACDICGNKDAPCMNCTIVGVPFICEDCLKKYNELTNDKFEKVKVEIDKINSDAVLAIKKDLSSAPVIPIDINKGLK